MDSFWTECYSEFEVNFVYAAHDLAKVILGYLEVWDVSFHMEQVSSHLEFMWSVKLSSKVDYPEVNCEFQFGPYG